MVDYEDYCFFDLALRSTILRFCEAEALPGHGEVGKLAGRRSMPMAEPSQNRFALKLEHANRHDMLGEPLRELPEWGGVAALDGLKLILHPPFLFELAYQVPDYVIFLPYAPAVAEISFGDGPIRRRTIAAGAGVFVPPETVVRGRVLAPVEFLAIAAAPRHIEPIITKAAGGRAWKPEPIPELIDEGIAGLSRELRRSLLADPLIEPAYLEALVHALAARFACKLSGAALGALPKEALPPVMLRRLTARIEQELTDNITLDDLAAEAGLSRWHFARAFQASTGLPPHEFILSRRVCRARDLLVSTDEPVAQIAVSTGFSSHGHLNKAFKKRLGLTPTAYREAFRLSVCKNAFPG
jgi:AraC-like DNA-binding protein